MDRQADNRQATGLGQTGKTDGQTGNRWMDRQWKNRQATDKQATDEQTSKRQMDIGRQATDRTQQAGRPAVLGMQVKEDLTSPISAYPCLVIFSAKLCSISCKTTSA